MRTRRSYGCTCPAPSQEPELVRVLAAACGVDGHATKIARLPRFSQIVAAATSEPPPLSDGGMDFAPRPRPA